MPGRRLASGPVVSTPPSGARALQVVPFQVVWYSWLSLPRMKTSVRLTPFETAPGSAVSVPPRDAKAPHVVPFQWLCHSALSVPRVKTSSLVPEPAAASGLEVQLPPSDVHVRKPMLNERITLPDGTYTPPPASAGVTKRLIPNEALWKICAPLAALNA